MLTLDFLRLLENALLARFSSIAVDTVDDIEEKEKERVSMLPIDLNSMQSRAGHSIDRNRLVFFVLIAKEVTDKNLHFISLYASARMRIREILKILGTKRQCFARSIRIIPKLYSQRTRLGKLSRWWRLRPYVSRGFSPKKGQPERKFSFWATFRRDLLR